VEVFKARALGYDAWYVKHPSLYKSELLAAARLGCRGGVEVGWAPAGSPRLWAEGGGRPSQRDVETCAA
jgi:hypothetical protein